MTEENASSGLILNPEAVSIYPVALSSALQKEASPTVFPAAIQKMVGISS